MIIPLGLDALESLCTQESALFGSESFPLSRRALRYHLKKGTPIWGAFHEGQLVGYIMLFVYKKSARIYSLGVHKDARGLGMGQALIKAVFAFTRQKSLARLTLEVRSDNQKAIKLYERMGFVLKKVVPCYYPDGTDALRMNYLHQN